MTYTTNLTGTGGVTCRDSGECLRVPIKRRRQSRDQRVVPPAEASLDHQEGAD